MRVTAKQDLTSGNGKVSKGTQGTVIELVYAKYAKTTISDMEFDTDNNGDLYPVRAKFETVLGDVMPNRKPQYRVLFDNNVEFVLPHFYIEITGE